MATIRLRFGRNHFMFALIAIIVLQGVTIFTLIERSAHLANAVYDAAPQEESSTTMDEIATAAQGAEDSAERAADAAERTRSAVENMRLFGIPGCT